MHDDTRAGHQRAGRSDVRERRPASRVPAWAMATTLATACALLFAIASPVSVQSRAAAQTPASATATPLFVEEAASAGLDFTHVNGATGQFHMPEIMGSGAALFDYDNDGDLDVFLVQGTPSAPSRLFRNDLRIEPDCRRTLRFTDVTAHAGITARGVGMGVAVADYDNDGDLDLLLTTFGPETLYRNNGDGTFTDVTREAGVSDDLWSSSAAFLDYDRDGDLDLFVANYLDFTTAANKLCYDAIGARDYCTPRAYRPARDRLWRNDGRGRFTDVSEAAGITAADGAGLGVSVGDYNHDGWLDLFVANDATPNQLWINQRDGRFVETGLASGAALNANGNPEGCMGIASGDYDADGDEDLFVTNIVGETFVLYANDGGGTFTDVRVRAGLARPTAPSTGFGTEWFDYDLDGWLDLFAANGAVNALEAQRGQPFPYRMKNQLFRNLGTGRFEETSARGGSAFARAEVSRAAAFGDIDNDGDIDILVTTNNGPVRLLVNQAIAASTPGVAGAPGAARAADSKDAKDTKDAGRNAWLQLALRQESGAGGLMALGARVGVERAGKPTLWRRVRTDGSYLSASDARVHVGLGAADADAAPATPAAAGAAATATATTAASADATTPAPATLAVIVEWPDGVRERWTGVQPNRLHTLKRGSGK